MARKAIKIRAKEKNGVVTVKALMTHSMDTGRRKNKKTGQLIPEHFITEVLCQSKGKVLLSTEWSSAISKNPYLSFRYKGGVKGDMVSISWIDNEGKTASAEAKIK